MSSRRIIIGLLVGIFTLAGVMAAVWHFDLPWQLVPISIPVVAGVVSGIIGHAYRGRSLRPYWDRACMGIRWRRRFPKDPKKNIREFLRIFIDAFALSKRRHYHFSPDDRVIDVYRALYHPDDSLADNMELEFLAMKLQKQYGFDLIALWREDITLGELYEQTRARAA